MTPCRSQSGKPNDNSQEAALKRALALLERRAHSRRELSDKLRQRKFPPDIVGQALAELERLHLLDDLQFAELFIREKLIYASRPLGQRRIMQDLRRRGIDEATAKQAWSTVEQEERPEPESERAGEAARRKLASLRDREDPRRVRARLWRHLASRGFDAESAGQAVEQAMREQGLW